MLYRDPTAANKQKLIAIAVIAGEARAYVSLHEHQGLLQIRRYDLSV